MTNDEKAPVMDIEDVESNLRETIDRQQNMIRVALAYLHAGQNALAEAVLEGTETLIKF
jgi:hypothetical protein